MLLLLLLLLLLRMKLLRLFLDFVARVQFSKSVLKNWKVDCGVVRPIRFINCSITEHSVSPIGVLEKTPWATVLRLAQKYH